MDNPRGLRNDRQRTLNTPKPEEMTWNEVQAELQIYLDLGLPREHTMLKPLWKRLNYLRTRRLIEGEDTSVYADEKR